MAPPLRRLPRSEDCEHSVPLNLDAAEAGLGQPAMQVGIVTDGTERARAWADPEPVELAPPRTIVLPTSRPPGRRQRAASCRAAAGSGKQ